jgi:hypothetical protein
VAGAVWVDPEIEAGRELCTILEQATDLRVEAAFWWQEDGEWRFVVATPVVHEEGRLAAHKKITEAVGPDRLQEFRSLLDRLDVLSPSESLITVLDIGSEREVPLHRRIVREAVRSVYVEGAYFYLFAPRTFAPA